MRVIPSKMPLDTFCLCCSIATVVLPGSINSGAFRILLFSIVNNSSNKLKQSNGLTPKRLSLTAYLETSHNQKSNCLRWFKGLDTPSRQSEVAIVGNGGEGSPFLFGVVAIWSEDTEDGLIRLIQESPSLYNLTGKRYANTVTKAQL